MTGENKFFKYLKIVIGFLVAILFLLPIFILLMDSFKNQKGILTDVLGWPNPFIFDNYPKAMEKMNFFNSLLEFCMDNSSFYSSDITIFFNGSMGSCQI